MFYLDNTDYLIMSLWAFFFSIFLILPLFKRGVAKTKNIYLQTNKKLIFFTKIIFISGTMFYFVSFLGIGELKILFLENVRDVLLFAGLLFIIAGMIFMLISRWQLRSLDNREIFSSINNSELVIDGIYRYMNHPMYIGLIMIFFGSFIIYRNLISIIFFFVILYFIYKKIVLEKSSGGAIN